MDVVSPENNKAEAKLLATLLCVYFVLGAPIFPATYWNNSPSKRPTLTKAADNAASI